MIPSCDARPEFVKLAGQTPIASGRVRDVWPRPGRDDEIIKTIVERKRRRYQSRTGVVGLYSHMTLGPYRTFMIEYREYARVAYRAIRAGRPNPIIELGGLIPTDRGLGQVCRRVRDAHGDPGRTLRSFFHGRELTQDLVERLNIFVKDVFDLGVKAPDLSADNIMFDGMNGRFVLVDGFGHKTLVPVRHLTAKGVDRRTERWLSKFAVDQLAWNSANRTFTLRK